MPPPPAKAEAELGEVGLLVSRFPQISEVISPPRLSDQGEGGSGTRGVKDEFDGFGGDLLHVSDELAQAVVVGDPLRVALGVLRR